MAKPMVSSPICGLTHHGAWWKACSVQAQGGQTMNFESPGGPCIGDETWGADPLEQQVLGARPQGERPRC
jgi:hypothetical protein